MGDFSDKKQLLSEYNEAGFQIERLNYLWQLCNTYARQGLLDKWKWTLDRAWIELAADAKQKDDKADDEKKYSSKLKKLNEDITNAKDDKEKLYNALQEKEIFLRCLQEDVGKGSKKSHHFEDIM